MPRGEARGYPELPAALLDPVLFHIGSGGTGAARRGRSAGQARRSAFLELRAAMDVTRQRWRRETILHCARYRTRRSTRTPTFCCTTWAGTGRRRPDYEGRAARLAYRAAVGNGLVADGQRQRIFAARWPRAQRHRGNSVAWRRGPGRARSIQDNAEGRAGSTARFSALALNQCRARSSPSCRGTG